MVLILAAWQTDAATRTKADNADDLNLASSWTNGIVPAGADAARFDATISGPLTLALGADTTWNQLNFVDPGGAITISAGGVLTLGNNTPLTFATGTADLTLECDVVFAGAGFATLPSPPGGSALTLGGAIRGRDATVTLGNSPGILRLGGAATTQLGATVQVSSSGVKLGIGASSAGDPIESGPLGTNQFTWNSSQPATELFAYGGAQTLRNAFRIQASPLNFNSADDLSFTGIVDLNNGNRTVNVASNGVLRFAGTLSNAAGMTKVGPGVLELGGTNVASWNNGLSVLGGTVRLLASDMLPDAGFLRMTNTSEVLDLGGFNETVRGLTAAGSSGDWNGTVDNTAAGTTSVLTVGDDFTYVLAGELRNSGPGSRLALVKVGAGGLTLTNAKSFSGGITNASASRVSINSPGAAGTGPLVLAHTNAELSYGGGASLVWTNDIILEANTEPVISAEDGSLLEVAGTISGPGRLWRGANFGFTGPLTLSGNNTFTGGFVLAGGAITLGHPRALGGGAVSIGDPAINLGGSLVVVSSVDLSGASAVTNELMINRDFTVGGTNSIEFAGPVTWVTNATQRTINITNMAGVTLSGGMNGYGFNKVGQGTLTLNGPCSHNGPSTISTGPLAIGPNGVLTGDTILLVGGSGLLDLSAANGFTVATNQILRGSGRVRGDFSVAGGLEPGNVFSTLTCSNNVTLQAGSRTLLQVSTQVTPREKLVCHGILAFGGSLVVTNVGPALQAGDSFDLFGFAGTTGAFAEMILPELDEGLTWETGQLSTDGSIRVVTSVGNPPSLSNPQLIGLTNFLMTAGGGLSNGQFRVLSHTDIEAPLLDWETLSTNTYDGNGSLVITNPASPDEPRRFFRIVQP